MSARMKYRKKPKKRTNRYNPNNPNWAAVHSPWLVNLLMPRNKR